MRSNRIPGGAGLVGTLAVVLAGTATFVLLGGPTKDEPDRWEGLARRLRSMLVEQEEGHILLPPGDPDVTRTVEAAHALNLLGQLDDAHLRQTLDELGSSWSATRRAYLPGGGPAEYEDSETGRALYDYDVLALNVRATEFLQRVDSHPTVARLPLPDLRALVADLETEGRAEAILRARALRAVGDRGSDGSAPTCDQVARLLRRSRIGEAADLAMTLPMTSGCAPQVGPLLGRISDLEHEIISRIDRELVYTFDDVLALDQLRVLAETGGRVGPSADSDRIARLLLAHLDESAQGYGPPTETWVVTALGHLLDPAAPPLPHLVARLETLIDFRGSLATGATADWYTLTLMAHLLVMSGALTTSEVPDLFGHPSGEPGGAAEPDWAYAFVGLRPGPGLPPTLPDTVLADDPSLVVQALYVADTGDCARAPDENDFTSVSDPTRLSDLSPGRRFGYLLALTVSVSCSPGLSHLLKVAADHTRLPDTPPDPAGYGALSFYHLEAETVCLAHGAVTVDQSTMDVVDAYLAGVSAGPVTQNLDFPDLYAALRLTSLHERGDCRGAWWEGLPAPIG